MWACGEDTDSGADKITQGSWARTVKDEGQRRQPARRVCGVSAAASLSRVASFPSSPLEVSHDRGRRRLSLKSMFPTVAPVVASTNVSEIASTKMYMTDTTATYARKTEPRRQCNGSDVMCS